MKKWILPAVALLAGSMWLGSSAQAAPPRHPHDLGHHRHGEKIGRCHGNLHARYHPHRHRPTSGVSLSFHFGSIGYHHDRQVPTHSGRIIADVQRQLNRRGYQAGIVDGVLGPRTRHAIRAFQVDRRLPVTGTINEAVLFHLGLI